MRVRSVHSERTLGGRKEFRGVEREGTARFPRLHAICAADAPLAEFASAGAVLDGVIVAPVATRRILRKRKIRKRKRKRKEVTYKKIGLLQVGKILDTKGLLARRAGESMLAAGSETGVRRRADALLRFDGRRPRTFGGTADLKVRRAGMNSVGVVAPVSVLLVVLVGVVVLVLVVGRSRLAFTFGGDFLGNGRLTFRAR